MNKTGVEARTYTLDELAGDVVEPIHLSFPNAAACFCGAVVNRPLAPLGTKPGPRCGVCANISMRRWGTPWGRP